MLNVNALISPNLEDVGAETVRPRQMRSGYGLGPGYEVQGLDDGLKKRHPISEVVPAEETAWAEDFVTTRRRSRSSLPSGYGS